MPVGVEVRVAGQAIAHLEQLGVPVRVVDRGIGQAVDSHDLGRDALADRKEPDQWE